MAMTRDEAGMSIDFRAMLDVPCACIGLIQFFCSLHSASLEFTFVFVLAFGNDCSVAFPCCLNLFSALFSLSLCRDDRISLIRSSGSFLIGEMEISDARGGRKKRRNAPHMCQPIETLERTRTHQSNVMQPRLVFLSTDSF